MRHQTAGQRRPAGSHRPGKNRERLRQLLEENGDQACDLRLWAIGPHEQTAIIGLSSHQPRPPQHYRDQIAQTLPCRVIAIEIQPLALPATDNNHM
ncbi:hypothetical protein [Desulfuromonas thiophila]|uniref:hypothetical protein n=1 Tax=Desulfuromonas thiophila TaxID=57664 RepID=UPI0024A8BD73|nr:hypothetical protein [Desulfuromonas thiophila]